MFLKVSRESPCLSRFKKITDLIQNCRKQSQLVPKVTNLESKGQKIMYACTVTPCSVGQRALETR